MYIMYISDSSGQVRDIWVRFVRDYPVENNDWGDFQTHRYSKSRNDINGIHTPDHNGRVQSVL